MSLDADAIVDRRRLRRKLTFWRVLAALIVLLAAGGFAFVLARGDGLLTSGGYIARVKVQGLIRDNRGRVEAIARLAKSRAKAVIVHIDSPGGTTAARSSFTMPCMHCRPRSRWWWWSTGWPPPAPISLLSPATTSSPTTPRSSARSACCSSIPTSPRR